MDLLSNILLIQQLDVIDGDGAILIYNRLVYLCNGSNDTAERLLDDAAILLPAFDFKSTTTTTTTTEDDNNNSITNKNNDTTTTQQCGINASPYTLPDCNNLDELLNVIRQFQSLLQQQQQQQQQQIMDESIIDTYHSKCIELVNGLTKEACIYLLANWLLSSTLCDISFFVTFQLLTGVDGSNVNEVRQSCNTGGIALCTPLENYELDDSTTDHTTNTTTTGSAITIPIHYEVKVVDCDPKPARKLRERKHVESKFHLIDENDIVIK
jgi:inositol-pentakisphosphate 2-kinase